jgi:hypothetical protein
MCNKFVLDIGMASVWKKKRPSLMTNIWQGNMGVLPGDNLLDCR